MKKGNYPHYAGFKETIFFATITSEIPSASLDLASASSHRSPRVAGAAFAVAAVGSAAEGAAPPFQASCLFYPLQISGRRFHFLPHTCASWSSSNGF